MTFIEQGMPFINEANWLTCPDSWHMLLYYVDDVATERKLRLFACACCRRIWHRLEEDCLREAITIAERFADAQATHQDLALVSEAVWGTLSRLDEAEVDDSDSVAAQVHAAHRLAADAVAKAATYAREDGTLYIDRDLAADVAITAWDVAASSIAEAHYKAGGAYSSTNEYG